MAHGECHSGVMIPDRRTRRENRRVIRRTGTRAVRAPTITREARANGQG